jgi:hypothetical protein
MYSKYLFIDPILRHYASVQFLLNERVEQQQILEGVESEQAEARESIENLDGDGGRGVGTRHRGDSAGEGGLALVV